MDWVAAEVERLTAEMTLDVRQPSDGGLVPRRVQHDVRAPLGLLAAGVAPHHHAPRQMAHLRAHVDLLAVVRHHPGEVRVPQGRGEGHHRGSRPGPGPGVGPGVGGHHHGGDGHLLRLLHVERGGGDHNLVAGLPGHCAVRQLDGGGARRGRARQLRPRGRHGRAVQVQHAAPHADDLGPVHWQLGRHLGNAMQGDDRLVRERRRLRAHGEAGADTSDEDVRRVDGDVASVLHREPPRDEEEVQARRRHVQQDVLPGRYHHRVPLRRRRGAAPGVGAAPPVNVHEGGVGTEHGCADPAE
mmetsp:Transcript_37964/g.94097  ORF Transcript_37964/g.94097 Transcript_37964/m.94097 type:complete len:299 (+) Transcript_37964:3292-4188(+)